MTEAKEKTGLGVFLARHRLAVVLCIALVTVLFMLGIPRIRTDVILQDLFPQDHPYLKLMIKFGQIFGSGGSNVVIAVNAKHGDIFKQKTLNKIKAITDEIILWPEVYRLLTSSIASQNTKVVKTLAKGEILIDQLMFPDVPENAEEMALLKMHIFSNLPMMGFW